MSVELTVSNELLDAIGPEQFEHYLSEFNAIVISTRPTDYGFRIIYTLDIPGAPANAVRVEPLYGTHYDGPTATPFLIRLDWYAAAGCLMNTTPETTA